MVVPEMRDHIAASSSEGEKEESQSTTEAAKTTTATADQPVQQKRFIVDEIIALFSNYIWSAIRITTSWTDIDNNKDKVFARITNVRFFLIAILRIIDQ